MRCGVEHLSFDLVAMSQAPHSDLEVVPQSEAPEAQKYAYYANAPEPVPHQSPGDEKEVYASNVHEQNKPPTICGLRKRTFWILVIVAVVIVAAAVGGGVGGALASKSSNDTKISGAGAGEAQSSGVPQSSSTTPTPTTQSSISITTTSIVGPSSTIFRDCPSSNNSLYDVNFGDTKMTFRKACDISFLNANGIDNVVGKPLPSLNDCINACAQFNVNNKTQIEQGGRLCNAVCWRNTFDKINDWAGGMCFGFTTLNSSGTFRYRLPPETRCDSAALINQAF